MLKVFGNTYEVSREALEAQAKEAFLYIGDDFEVNFRFVSEERIKKLNRVYRSKNRSTDVLSFKLEEDMAGGDIVICYKEAVSEAKAWKMSLDQTVSLLLVHGILHLAGFDHTNPKDRAKMEAHEAAILEKKGIKIER